MNILLVMPHSNPKRSFFSKFQYPSSTLQQIAALTPQEHQVTLIDERYKDVPFSSEYDLVGISALTYNAKRGYEIAKKYKELGVPVVFGGYHASLMPDEVKDHADSVVVGEAELTWPQLLKDFQAGKMKKIYTSPRVVKAEEIIPARHDIGVFTPFSQAIQATRGCPVGCEWCAMNRVEGKKFRARPIKEVIDEMKSIDAKTIFFADASITINPKYTKELFKEMKKLNKKFECFGNINVVARDEEFLQLSKEAGVTKWYLGIESISQENINQAGKSTNKVKDYKKAVQNIKKDGMDVTGFFIFGLDGDTLDTFDSTLKAMNEFGLDEASFSILTPYPGTPLFTRMEKEGRITNYNWNDYDEGKVNYTPKHMTKEELLEGIRRISLEFYSVKNCLRRSVHDGTMNPIKILTRFIANMSIRSFYINEKFPKTKNQ